jgi:hypothetical protein
VHRYRTARIARPVFSFVSEYGDHLGEDVLAETVKHMVAVWFESAFELGLLPNKQGDNHVVFEFEGGLLAAYSDYSLTIGTGLILEDW